MMREEWRLIDTGVHDAYYNMALDEAIVIAKSRGLVPVTLRLFRWAPSAVSIGYFQSMEDEVDVNVCKQMGVDCVRRRTGGGAVYHDTEGELTYSLIIEEENPLVSVDFQKTYETLCAGLVRGLQLLGVSAAFKPINDIVVDGRKISGNAQTRSMKVVHQHGTILRTVNPTRMFSLLKISNEKIRDKMIRSAEERVTSVNRILQRNVSFEELKTAVIRGFEEAFNLTLKPAKLTVFEKKLALKLAVEKYSSSAWNYKR